MNQDWLPCFMNRSPAFEIFSRLCSKFLTSTDWPTLADYNSLRSEASDVVNFKGQAIHFVEQTSQSQDFNSHYEPRIYLTGEVQTRLRNWHDFFNVLIWCTFPRIKAQLNQLQYHELSKRNTNAPRSPLENFLTLFDENGLIIMSSDEDLLQLIREMQWRELFWTQRKKLVQLRCYVLGHSLHEKLLNPYIGMVGHGVLMAVNAEFWDLSLVNQIVQMQNRLLDLDIKKFTTKCLHPIPILGFPEWYSESCSESFYENENYFRRKSTLVR